MVLLPEDGGLGKVQLPMLEDQLLKSLVAGMESGAELTF